MFRHGQRRKALSETIYNTIIIVCMIFSLALAIYLCSVFPPVKHRVISSSEYIEHAHKYVQTLYSSRRLRDDSSGIHILIYVRIILTVTSYIKTYIMRARTTYTLYLEYILYV